MLNECMQALCDAMAPVSKLPNAAAVRSHFAEWVVAFWGRSFPHDCFYDTACLKDEARAAEWQPTSRAWRWQKCNEVAYLQPAPQTLAPLRSRHLTLDSLVAQCREIFGGAPKPYAGPAEGSQATLRMYGGAADIRGSRIFFSDFSDDPWQRASVREQLSPLLPYAYVKCDGCGHCMDLGTPNTGKDPPQLRAERQRFEQSLAAWLADASPDA